MDDKELKLECLRIAQKYCFNEVALNEMADRLWKWISGKPLSKP